MNVEQAAGTTSYRFVNLREDGKPDLPEGIEARELARLPDAAWALYEVASGCESGEPAGDDLATLIDSAKRYPPALALARGDGGQVFVDRVPDREEFAKVYADAIREYLSRQPRDPYVLARLLDGTGWYWVLRIHGAPPMASFVGADFDIDERPATDLDLTGQQMRHLGCF